MTRRRNDFLFLLVAVAVALATIRANPWLRRYLKADAEGGELHLYVELAAADGRYEGYLKPLLRDIDFYTLEEAGSEENPLRQVWEASVDLASEVFENQPRDQVAARIPIRGTIEGAETEVVATLASVLSNAFVEAFARSIDHSVSLETPGRRTPKATSRASRSEVRGVAPGDGKPARRPGRARGKAIESGSGSSRGA